MCSMRRPLLSIALSRRHGIQTSRASALYFALTNAFPDEDEFPDAFEAAVVLAVEAPWIGEVRRLVADQDELARLWISEEE